MLDKVRRHFRRVRNNREVRELDSRLCSDIGLDCGHGPVVVPPPVLRVHGPLH